MKRYFEQRALGTLVLCGLIGLTGVRTSQANVIKQHTWDMGSHGWTQEFNDVNLTVQPADGNPNGWLSIAFPETSAPEILEEEWFDIIRVDSDRLFAGNWDPHFFIRFDFFASNQLPQDLQLQFHSTNNNVWGYNVTDQVTQTQTWTTVEVSLGFSAGWGPLPGFDDTEEQFLADLSAIDWIGIYIFREDSSVEVYGIDNFRLLVPEPEEFAMLAAVFLAFAWSQRRRREPG
ncbi:MAG: hypothetical protein O3A51_11460 [Verrucomicrobia bacterium]|nr:hypothetical protein [Verrucomicrobiota bacterium]